MSRVAITGFLFLLLLAGIAHAAASADPVTAQVIEVNPNAHTLTIQDGTTPPHALTVTDPVLQRHLRAIAAKDTVIVAFGADATTVTRLSKLVTLDSGTRLLALGIPVLGLLVLTCLVMWRRGGPRALVLGADNRYSNSKVQLALWSTTVFTAWLATIGLRVAYGGDDWTDYLGGVAIPGNLAALSGLSALSFVGAKAVTTQKSNDAEATRAQAMAVQALAAANPTDMAMQAAVPVAMAAVMPGKEPAPKPSMFADLLTNDRGKADIGDFQMILITVVAALLFIGPAYGWLGHLEIGSGVSLPDVDSTLLSGFGIGQGAYLAKKLASNPGEG